MARNIMRNIRKIALMAVGDETWIGGIQYIINIIAALNEIDATPRLQVSVFKSPHQRFDTGLDLFKNIELQFLDIDETLLPYSLYNRAIWFFQRKILKRVNPRLENYLLENGYDYVYPATLSTCRNKLNVGSWIADFQYHNFPHGHSRETTIEAEAVIRRIANQMSKIVFSSNYCMQQAFELFPVTKSKAWVMPFAVHIPQVHLDDMHIGETQQKYHITEPYLIVSNLFAAVKNHKLLFRALGLLRKRNIKVSVVCTGNFVNYFQMEFTNDVLQVINETGIRDQLFILGLIPREDQVALYRGAVAMVQPSLHEGWSTCVEEAKCLGKTLVLSDIEVHREQFPGNPHFFNPYDEQALANIIEAVYNSGKSSVFPDIEVEKKAFREYRNEVRSFGENFLRIAQN